MKKGFRAALFCTFLAPTAAKTQSLPQTFPYQAIVRDAAGKPLDKQPVNLVLEIKATGGAVVYAEDHDLVTSPFGLVTVSVGAQKAADFQQIDWKNGPFLLRAVFSGSVNLETESPFQAVPFAFLAAEVLQEKQTLDLTDNQLSITGGNSISLPTGITNPWENAAGGIVFNGPSVGIGSTDFSNNVGLSIKKNATFRDATGSPRLTATGYANGGYYLTLAHPKSDYQTVLASQPDSSSFLSTGSDSKGYFRASSYLNGNSYASIFDGNKKSRTVIGLENGLAFSTVFNQSGNLAASMSNSAAGESSIKIFDENEMPRITSQVKFGPTEPEALRFFNEKGTPRAQISAFGENPKNGGSFVAFDSLGIEKANFFSGERREGHAFFYNFDHAPASPARGVELSGKSPFGGAFVRLYADNDQLAGSMYVDAAGLSHLQLTGTKNFVQDHPTDPKKQIVFACIEGPEAAVYLRGTAKLVKGEAKIDFPEAFRLVVSSPESMTIQLTPRSEKSRGLAAVERSSDGFRVREMRRGTGYYDFDWEIKGVRKGFENFEPIRSKN